MGEGIEQSEWADLEQYSIHAEDWAWIDESWRHSDRKLPARRGSRKTGQDKLNNASMENRPKEAREGNLAERQFNRHEWAVNEIMELVCRLIRKVVDGICTPKLFLCMECPKSGEEAEAMKLYYGKHLLARHYNMYAVQIETMERLRQSGCSLKEVKYGMLEITIHSWNKAKKTA